MPSVGAATFWMNSPAPVEIFRLRRVPLLAALLGFAAGDGLALRWHPPAQVVGATALLLAISLFSLRKRVALVPALALWIAAGCWCAQMEPPVPRQQALVQLADGLSRTVRGSVVRVRALPRQRTAPERATFEPGAWEADAAPEIESVDIDVQAVEVVTPDVSIMQPTSGGVRMTITGAALPLRCGDLVEVPLRMRTPDVYRDPGAWSYSDQLLSEGMGVTASSKSSQVRVVRRTKPTLRCRMFSAQAWAGKRLQGYLDSPANRALPRDAQLHSEDAAMLNAMLFGDRTHLTQMLRMAFERTGTFHLFVVSGLHVALLAAGLFWLLRRLRLPEGWAVLIAIMGASAYAGLTGFGIPAQRALLMTSIFLIARWIDREITALNALGAAALVVLIADPRAMFEGSFQMTFLVILAIAGVAVPLSQRLVRPHLRALRNLEVVDLDAHLHPEVAQFRVRLRMACGLCGELLHGRLRSLPVWVLRAAYWVADALLFGVAAEVCMVLPMAMYFHRATLLALPLNLVDIPLLSVLLCVAILMFLCSLVSAWLAALPGAVTALLLHAMRFSVERFQHAAIADVRTPGPGAVAVAVACCLIALACVALRGRRQWVVAAGVMAALLVPVVVLYPTQPLLHGGVLEVTALDVGQGDSLLVVTPEGKTILVDAGGPVGRGALASTASWDVGEEVVAPYLWSRRLRRLDVVMLTHAHSDHMGGMPAVLRDFRPRELWISIVPGDSVALRALLKEAQDLGIAVRHFHAGDAFRWSDVEATVLAPEVSYSNAGSPVNDDSLVMRIDFGRSSVLLEGDAEAPSEAAMVADGRLSPVTLLKVGHHGSRTSTNPGFLAAVSPRDAVISVGKHNTFGHPRGEVLGRLEAAHVRTFRTDRGGAETFLLGADGGIAAIPTASK
jgi:competence protein ComEC